MSIVSQTLSEKVFPRKYDFVVEDVDGFGVVQPVVGSGGISLPAFKWNVGIRVGKNGQRGRCDKVEIGAVQNVVKYRAEARWKSGTTWVWRIPGLPLRDVVKGQDGPFYNKDFRFVVASCGETVSAQHGDSPRVLRQPGQPSGYKPKGAAPGAIPWDDPRTSAPRSLESFIWYIDFNAFMIQFDPQTKDSRTIQKVGWGVRVEIVFDMTQPVSKRGRIKTSEIPIVRGVTTEPLIGGTIAGTKLRLDQARSPAEAAKLK